MLTRAPLLSWPLSASLLSMAFMTLLACAPPLKVPRLPAGPEGTRQWRQARAEVRQLRQRYEATEPYSMNVALELTQLQLGQRMRARGTVAVKPPHALRMILLGPGGTTALDLWVCRDEYRFTVPALSLERRGDRHTPLAEQRGLPVNFLRWWFLRPLHGRLLSAYHKLDRDRPQQLRAHYVMRDNDAIVHLSQLLSLDPSAAVSSTAALHSAATARGASAIRPAAAPPLLVRRLANGDEERLQVTGPRCGEVRYQQRSTGLAIAVSCEQINPSPPPDRAFADPTQPDKPCGDGDG